MFPPKPFCFVLRFQLRVRFASNIIETKEEEYNYTFSSIVSEVGGSFGLFLGLSVFAIFDSFIILGFRGLGAKDGDEDKASPVLRVRGRSEENVFSP